MELARLTNELPVLSVEEEILARMEIARQELAQAKNLSEAKRVADGAAAIREWLKRQSDIGLAILNDASLLKLEAEARMGEYLQQPGVVQERGRPKTSQAVTFSPPTHKELGINRESARRYQQVSTVPRQTLRELAVEATKRGVELTREAVLKVAQKIAGKAKAVAAAAVPHERAGCPGDFPPEFHNAIITGDAKDLSTRLPDNSVALCFCDPVYKRIEDYEWLARECERVLVPGGNLIAQCGTLPRFDCEVAMRKSGLQYVDLLAEVYPYALCPLYHIRVQVGWKPYLWFSKGKRSGEWMMNRVAVGGKKHADASKEIHPWGDGEQFASGVIGKLCEPGDLVWDPFTGSGTVPVVAAKLGLPFVAFEIDAATAADARMRVAGTPRVVSPQQTLVLEDAA